MDELLTSPCAQHARGEEWHLSDFEEIAGLRLEAHELFHARPRIRLRSERRRFGNWQWVAWSDRTERIFQELAERWKSETRYMSSLTKMALHPAYQSIIGMGEAALPFIFQELEKNGGHWLWALHAITREDPAKPGDDFDAAVQAWLNWGMARGYLR